MKSFATSIVIDAPAQQVWALLTDLAAWPDWNTTVTRVEGAATAGSKVTVHTRSMPGRAFPVKVAELLPPARMVWTGGIPLGLFTGTRSYVLEPQAGGGTRFSMQEAFTGLMAPLITQSIPDLQPTFEEFAACLKTAAERHAT